MGEPFFSYAAIGVRFGLTREEAERNAAAAVDYDAEGSTIDGWPDTTVDICWGVKLFQATEVDREDSCCEECGALVGEQHEDDCPDWDGENAYRDEFDYRCSYRLEPVPGAVEAVLALATVEQLRAELARREVDRG